jgi:hypothetical protein
MLCVLIQSFPVPNRITAIVILEVFTYLCDITPLTTGCSVPSPSTEIMFLKLFWIAF